MNPRVQKLRRQSLDTAPSISIERALLLTDFYRDNLGRWPQPVLRARAFRHVCAHKTIFIGDGELIVGERGHAPKATPTYPEISCHSVDDLHTLNDRPMTSYAVSDEDIERYEREVIPFWQGRTVREQMFAELPAEWHQAFAAGVFTEFMEQRAPGHTVADGSMYRKGLLDLRGEIAAAVAALDFESDRDASARRDQLEAMDIAADAAILFAERHAVRAEEMALAEKDPVRRAELLRIATVCRRVPANPPRDFWEALQTYWFYHLGVITELNGWDAFNPGHFDQHLAPFFAAGLADGSLDRESAKELLECLWVKFNNHPAPPKVGVTAAESGTYTDFANINLGGLDREGSDAVNDVSFLMLEVIDEMHLLQPSNNIQLSRETSGRFSRGRARRHPQGLRLSVHLQRRCGGRGTGAPGQEPRGRPRGRHLGLCRGRGLRQGGLHPHRLFQSSQSCSNWRSTTALIRALATNWDRQPAIRGTSGLSTSCSRHGGDRSTISWRSNTAATRSSSACTRPGRRRRSCR